MGLYHMYQDPRLLLYDTLIIPPSCLICFHQRQKDKYLQFLQAKYSTKINKIKIGSTLLGDVPSEVVIYVMVIFEYQDIN